MFWLGILIGAFLGGLLSVIAMLLMAMAKDVDQAERERLLNHEWNGKEDTDARAE